MTTNRVTRARRPEIRELLQKTDSERIHFINEDHWIGYPRANALLRQMAALVELPERSRPTSMMIVGDTNNGKSTLAKQFQKRFPGQDDPVTGGSVRPVVVLDTPPSADEDRLYNHILSKLGAVYKIRAPKDAKLFQICRLLKDLKVRVLVLDEINNALAGNATQRQQMLNAIKSISNTLERPIILTGTDDALTALRDDKQLQNRFPPQFLLPWELDHNFLKLLVSFEFILPLKRRTDMTNPNLAALLMAMSDGYIGELRNLLVLASTTAIETGVECINRKLLLELPWVPPSLRDQQATAAALGEQYHINYNQRLRELTAQLANDDSEDEEHPLEEENWEEDELETESAET